MIHYYYGPDTYGARQAIDQLAQEHGSRLVWVDSLELGGVSLSERATQGVSLFGKQLIVIRDPMAAPAAVQEEIVGLVERERDQLVVLWDRGSVDKRTALWRAVRSMAREFALLSPEALAAWLGQEAKNRGGTIAPDATAVLIERLGRDRWQLVSELERLLLVTNNSVTAEAVVQHVAGSITAEIFPMLDALMQGEARRTMQQLHGLLEGGHSEFYILSMLAYQFRVLLLVHEGLRMRKTQHQIAREGRLHPYVVEKTVPLVRQLAADRLVDALARIAATDFAIKQGTVEARTAVTMLVLNLVRQQRVAIPFASRPGPARAGQG